MELEQIWEEALKMIEEETSPVSFATWIQPIVPCGIIGNKIILQVKESFLKEIIEKRHLPLIRTAIKMVTKNEYDIMITTEEEQKAGNTEFDSAAAVTMQSLRDMHREEMDWFLDHCLEPFTRTLDQL